MADKPQNARFTDVNGILCPDLDLYPPTSPPDLLTAPLNYFLSIPWTAALLPPSATKAIPFIPQARNPFTSKHDQLIGHTLSSPRALRHVLCFFTPSDPQHVLDPKRPIREIHTFWDIGDGLSGYPSVLHGGMIMTFMDEAMGLLTELNRALGKAGAAFKTGTMTGSLEIQFLKPVVLDSVICTTALLEEIDGRKVKISCVVKDSEGIELARCRSIFIALRAKV